MIRKQIGEVGHFETQRPVGNTDSTLQILQRGHLWKDAMICRRPLRLRTPLARIESNDNIGLPSAFREAGPAAAIEI